MSSERTLVRVMDVAEELGVSRSQVYRLLGQGKLEAVKMGGLMRIKQESVRVYIDTLPVAVFRGDWRDV